MCWQAHNRHSKPGFALLVGLLVLTVLTGTALAHAGLKSARPAPGETVDQSPAEILLTFTEPVTEGSISLLNADGEVVPTTLRDSPRPDQVLASVDISLVSEEYRVLWMATSDDGDPVTGSYNFSVASKSNSDNEDRGFSAVTWTLAIAIMVIAVSGWWWIRRRIFRATQEDNVDRNTR
jgi:methionine-rich copper-binding protein CopC